MKVLLQSHDLSEDYLRFAAQIGADGIDVGTGRAAILPGVSEKGYVDEVAYIKGLLAALES